MTMGIWRSISRMRRHTSSTSTMWGVVGISADERRGGTEVALPKDGVTVTAYGFVAVQLSHIEHGDSCPISDRVSDRGPIITTAPGPRSPAPTSPAPASHVRGPEHAASDRRPYSTRIPDTNRHALDRHHPRVRRRGRPP